MSGGVINPLGIKVAIICMCGKDCGDFAGWLRHRVEEIQSVIQTHGKDASVALADVLVAHDRHIVRA